MGWKVANSLNPEPRLAAGISRAQGSVVGRPNNSPLNQLPNLPIPCAIASAGAIASAKKENERLRFLTRKKTKPASAPINIAPQIPRPPSQIFNASRGEPPAPKYSPGYEIT